MTYNFPAVLARLSLTPAQAARLVGVDERTARRWMAGSSEVPQPVRRLLWACEGDATLAPAIADAFSRTADEGGG